MYSSIKKIHIRYLPALVNLEISKSFTSTFLLFIMYSSGSLMKCFLLILLPAPDAPTTIQNKFRAVFHVKNKPFIVGPNQISTNGKTVAICKATGALVSWQINLWYLYTFSGKIFCQLKEILNASS